MLIQCSSIFLMSIVKVEISASKLSFYIVYVWIAGARKCEQRLPKALLYLTPLNKDWTLLSLQLYLRIPPFLRALQLRNILISKYALDEYIQYVLQSFYNTLLSLCRSTQLLQYKIVLSRSVFVLSFGLCMCFNNENSLLIIEE